MQSSLSRLAGACIASSIAVAVQAAPCVTSPPGQAGYWNGESLAEAATGLSGTWRGSGSIAAGFAGRGFSFGGTHDAFLLPGDFALGSQNFTIECWIKRDSTAVASNDPEAGEFFANSNNGLAFGLVHDGRLYLSHIGNVSFYSTTSLRDLGWHHVAVVRDGGTISFFADGTLANSQPCSATFSLVGPYAIGGLGEPYAGISYGFRGNIDEVAAYNRALSATEILSLHAAGAAGRCPTGPGNLIANGGFEAPAYTAADGVSPGSQFVRTRNLPGWEVAAGEGAVDVELQDFSGTVAHSGTQCLDLEGAEGLGSYFIRQDVAVTAGKSYRLRFAYTKNPAKDRSQMRLDITGANFASQTFEATQPNSRSGPGWKTAEVEFTAAAATVQVQFTGTSPNPGYGMMLDSVSLTEIQKVQLANATATYSQQPVQTFPAFPVGQTIDGIIVESHNGWAIYPRHGVPETAVWETVSDTGFAGGTELNFKIHSLGYLGRHGLGRFRLSVTSDARTEFADGLNTGGDVSANWTVLEVISAVSSGNTTLTPLPDGSVLASGEHPFSEVYDVVATCPLSGITGIRLEALPDPSLPKGGPGRDFEGNFIVSEFEVTAAPAGSSGTTRPCTAIPSGLVAWYRAEGDANNITGAQNGVFGAPKYAAGKVGRAFDFDGSNEVVVPDSAAFNFGAFAAEAWVYPTLLDGDVDIIVNKEVFGFDTIAFEFGLKGPTSVAANSIPVGNLTLHLGGIAGLPDDYSGWTDSGVKVPLNEWSHVVVAYENGVASVFLNGALGKRLTGLTGTLRTVAGPLKIGSRSDSVVQSVPGTRFNGRIDEFSLFNRALTDGEVTALFNAQEQGKCFRDLPVGDLSLTLVGANRAATGEDFIVTAKVTNHGLSPAPGVMLTNIVPTGVSVIGITNSQGTADNLAGFVIANLGTIPGGETATVQLTCRALLNGNYTVNGTLGRADTDPEPANNQASLAFEALPLSLTLADNAEVLEHVGPARVSVYLSAPVGREVEFTFDTSDGVARASFDYTATSGTVRLPAGMTEATLEIPLLNDPFFEEREAFNVTLRSASVPLGRTNLLITIISEDEKPALSFGNVAVREGAAGTQTVRVPVTLTGVHETPVTAEYSAVAGTATTPTDYTGGTGTVTFAVGEREKFAEVTVLGDTAVEPNEYLILVFNSVVGAQLADDRAAVVIENDDVVPGQVAGFAWDLVRASPQVGESFPVRVIAVDGQLNPVPGFNGTVQLGALPGGSHLARMLITEVDHVSQTGSAVELSNVTTNDLDVSGWSVTFYDRTAWPLPRGTFTVPDGAAVGGGRTLRIVEGTGVGGFPIFRTGFPLNWGTPADRQLAVLLRDAHGRIADFFCALDAYPDHIRVPVAIPAQEWQGLPLPAQASTLTTYQRFGSRDLNLPADWRANTSSANALNAGLTVPFAGTDYLPVTPAVAQFQNGVWTGDVQVGAFAPQTALWADDGNGHADPSLPFAMSAPDDLALTLEVAPGAAAHPASEISYRATVTARGPGSSSNVTAVVRLPAYFGGNAIAVGRFVLSQGTNEVRTYATPGTPSPGPGIQINARFGTLPPGGSATIEFLARRISTTTTGLTVPSLQLATATVTRDQAELNLANNSAEAAFELNSGCAPLPASALAWWRGEANPQDSLGANHLQVIGRDGTGFPYAPGLTEGSLGFEIGADVRFQAENLHQWNLGAGQNFAVDFWMRVTGDARRDRIVLLDKRDAATGAGFELWVDGGRLAGRVADVQGNARTVFSRYPNTATVPDLRDGRWHHIALSVTRDAEPQRVTLYADGVATGGEDRTGFFGELGGAPLRFGFEGPSDNTELVGNLDEVTIHREALDAATVQALARAGAAAKCLATVTVDFVSPLPDQGTFPGPLSYQKPQKVTLTVTNEGPLALPAAWVATALDDGGSTRFLTPSLDTIVFSQWVNFHNFGPLAAGTNLLLEAEVTLTNVTSRSVAGFSAWQRQLPGQGYQLRSNTAFFSINPDGDADELPDAWELINGYDPLTAADATADTDGDGFRNVDEYLLGTDPRSVADLLEIELITLTDGGVQVRFPGKAGKVYGLFRRETLGADWTEVTRRSAADNSVIELSDPSPGAVSGFYRIQLITNP